MTQDKTSKAGYKKTKLGWIPEDWEVEAIKNRVKLKSGQHLNPDEYSFKKDGIPYFTGPTDFCNTLEQVSKWTTKGKVLGKSGQVLITVKGSGVGGLFQLKLNDISLGRQLMSIEGINTDNNYLYHQLYVKLAYFQKLASGNMIPGLSRKDILTTTIPFPPLPEQKAIAECLATWDKAIADLRQLIAQKQGRKKGLMQQLLTGKTRLPGFSEAWEERKLGEISKVTKGKALSSKNVTLGIYDVIAGGKTSPYKHNAYTHEQVITVSASGAYAGYVSLHLNKIWASDCSVIKEVEGSSSLLYIYNILRYLQQKIYVLQTGGAQPHVYPKDLESLKLTIPPLAEQTAIAQVLQTADREIGLLEQKLAQYEAQKKGLMQQLLTGERRLV